MGGDEWVRPVGKQVCAYRYRSALCQVANCSDERTEMLNQQNLSGFEHMSEFLDLETMRSHATNVAVEALNSIELLSRGAFFIGAPWKPPGAVRSFFTVTCACNCRSVHVPV